ALSERVRQYVDRGRRQRPAFEVGSDLSIPGRRAHHQPRAAHALSRQTLFLRGYLSRREKRNALVGAALGLQLAKRLSFRAVGESAEGDASSLRRSLGQFEEQLAQSR